MNDKKRKWTAALAVFLSLTVLTALLAAIALYGGVPQTKAAYTPSLAIVERFYMNTSNAVSDGAASAANVEKKYWISANATAAPKPDKNCYGETDDAAEVLEKARSAEALLDGQSLYFSPEVTLLKDSTVRYYLDETILVITWQEPIDNTVYTFSEIKIADPSQFRRYFAGGTYGSGKLAIPTEMASSVNAVVASSGDYYQFRSAGVIVYNGEVCRVSAGADTCYVDQNGDLHFTRANERMTKEEAQAYVEENQIQFSVAFGPILVENGEKNYFGGYGLGEVTGNFARAAICQMDTLHYLLVNANAGDGQSGYPTMYQFAERIYQTGCHMAYALDGGQTATMVMDGVLINQMTKNYQRKISDIIYFGTALPNTKG